MFNWINFLNFIFFFIFFIFFLNAYNFFFLILISEIMWVSLFLLGACFGTVIDDMFLLSFTFFILGFAAVELSIGLLLLIFLKNLNLSLNLFENFNKKNEVYLNNFLLKSLKKKNI